MSTSKKQLELAEKLAARRARHGGKKSKGRKVHPAVPDVSPGKRKKVRSHRHAHAKAAAMAKPMTLMQLDDSRGDGERLRQARQHNSIEARQKALCDILSHKIDLTDQRQSLVMHKYNCLRRARNAIEIMIIVTAALLTLMHATMAEFEGEPEMELRCPCHCLGLRAGRCSLNALRANAHTDRDARRVCHSLWCPTTPQLPHLLRPLHPFNVLFAPFHVAVQGRES